jgi:hypothetical protein
MGENVLKGLIPFGIMARGALLISVSVALAG